MYLANPNTFRFVEKIAVHPYHWPRHDIHALDFIGPRPEKDWTLATPREYTSDYFKRFDFLRELAALVTETDPARSYGLAGKKIWATEFGIPTKKLGGANASIPKEWKLFVFDRATPIPDGVGAIVWEDKWDAFFDQVSPDFLIQNAVEAFLVFTLRESAANESNDKNHSNFSLYRADWSSRMAIETVNRMASFFRQFRGGEHAPNAPNAKSEENAEQSKNAEQIELVRLFPSWEDPNTAGSLPTANPHGPGPGFPVCTYASPLLVTLQDQEGQELQEVIIVVPNDGPVTALHPKTGQAVWSFRLPIPDGFAPFFVSTPVQVKDKLVLAYQVRSTKTWQRTGHRVSVIDLNTRTVAADYPDLVLHAEKPASDGSGMIRLSPPTAHTRSLVHAPHPDKQMGYVYVSFGNPGDIQPWHGWVFEVDLDAWQAQGPDAAISAVLLTTPEMDCGKDGSYGDKEMICGGGVWTPAGPQVYPHGDSFEMIIPVGNGQLDMQRKDYAQSLMRVGPGLDFDPKCDANLCADFDQHDPDPACLASCQNLFIPRLLPDDPPFRPASGWCDTRTFMDCLARHDADLGGSAPLKVQVPNGPEVYVQPGKEGGLYLLDATHMGTLYDREQLVQVCGTKQDKCLESWAGMMITQPVLSLINGTPVVVVATFMRDHTHPAGLVALRIVMQAGVPRFEPLWQAPDFSTPEAVSRFRQRPGFVALAPFGGDDYAWVVDVDSQASGKGLLLGVRVKDGTIIARQEMLGRGQRFAQPLIHDDVVYVSSCQNDRGPAHLEAYAFQPATSSAETDRN